MGPKDPVPRIKMTVLHRTVFKKHYLSDGRKCDGDKTTEAKARVPQVTRKDPFYTEEARGRGAHTGKDN